MRRDRRKTTVSKTREESTHTFNALNCVLGFLLPMRFFRERMASFGWTVLDLMTSEISRLRGISSLDRFEVRKRGAS